MTNANLSCRRKLTLTYCRYLLPAYAAQRAWVNFLLNYLLRCFGASCWNSHTSAFSSADKVKLSWPAKVIMQFTCILKFPLKAKSFLSSADMIGCRNWTSLYEVWLMTEGVTFKARCYRGWILHSFHLLPGCILVCLHPKCQQACRTHILTVFVPSKSRQGLSLFIPGWVDLCVQTLFRQPLPCVPWLQCM